MENQNDDELLEEEENPSEPIEAEQEAFITFKLHVFELWFWRFATPVALFISVRSLF